MTTLKNSINIDVINNKSLDTTAFIDSLESVSSEEIAKDLIYSHEIIFFQATILVCDLIAKKLQELKVKEARICIFKTDYDDNGLYDGLYLDWIDNKKSRYSYSLFDNASYIEDYQQERAYNNFLDSDNRKARANEINKSINEIFYNDNLSRLGINSYFFNKYMKIRFTPSTEENIKNTLGQKEFEIFKSLKEKNKLEKNTKLLVSSAPTKTGKI